jgi:hypothetical protein
VANMQSMGMGV